MPEPAPGAPAPIPDPDAVPDGAVLFEAEVPFEPEVPESSARVRVERYTGHMSAGGIFATSNVPSLCLYDSALLAIRALLDRLRAAESRVAELEAARLNAAREAGEGEQ